MIRLLDVSSKTDKGLSEHNFIEIYEYFFHQWQQSNIKIFEIGILGGGSLEMWQKYFINAKVYGLDIVDGSRYDNERVKTFIGDQSKREDLTRVINEIGDVDILIEDGSHLMSDQQISFGCLFPYIKPEGYYVIEDVHSSLEPGFFYVTQDKTNSTLEMLYRYMVSKPPHIYSRYMLQEELEYLNENIEYINLFYRNRGSRCSMTAIVKKRLVPIAVDKNFEPFYFVETDRAEG